MTPGGLPPWQRRLTYLACALVYATGLLWLAAHYGTGREGGSFGARSPWESWSLKLHGAAAIGFLLALGSLMPRHIPEGLAKRRNVASGILAVATAAVLVITAWGLYYAGAEELRDRLSVLHWALGLAAGPLLALHALLGRHGNASSSR